MTRAIASIISLFQPRKDMILEARYNALREMPDLRQTRRLASPFAEIARAA